MAATIEHGAEERPHDAAPDSRRRASARDPNALLVLAVFTVLAIGLTFPNLAHFRTFIAGDSGDALLTLWIMRTVQAGLPHGWHALWNAPIFFPAHNTLAYSDTLLPVALLHWPLRLLFGDVAAFNLISLGAWVGCSWFSYRLARRYTHTWQAAFVAALVFTYAPIRLAHQVHFQLVVGGALVPLVVLAALRVLDAPSPGRGLVLGLALAALTLTASYYGAMLAVVLVVLIGGSLLLARPSPVRPLLTSLGIAVLVTGALVAPVAAEYLHLQQDPAFRRSFEPAGAAHTGDFAAVSADSYLLRHAPVIGSRSTPASRGVENRLFPGVVAVLFGGAGAVIVAGEARRRGLRHRRTLELLLLTVAGLVCVLLAFGDRFTVGSTRTPLPFALLRHVVPGFSGMRATARLTLGGELALAMLAAVGIDALLRARAATTRALLTVVLVGAVVAESATSLTFVRVPTAADDGGIAAALRKLPSGLVLELPINSSASGVAWPFTESPRQLEALRDGRPRVNGYSGFQSKGFDSVATTLDTFPTPQALAAARERGVRYVVLRTRLVGSLTPASLRAQIDADGVGRYTPETAATIVRGLPRDLVRRVDRLPGGYLIELR